MSHYYYASCILVVGGNRPHSTKFTILDARVVDKT